MDYLAFDFGDGTTCAAHYDDSFAGTNSEPQKLNIGRGMDEIWSVIGFDQNGENPYIGEAANRPRYKLFSHWKAKPSQYKSSGPDAWMRKTAVAFMRIVFENFLSNNPDYTRNGIRKGGPYTVVIGVPCDWNSADIEEYRKMASEAGIPNVEVVKESQAAMFYARRFMQGGISDEDIRNGVLLIDVGSSTTDFTYMRGAAQVGHCGLALGARAVEVSFLAEALKREKVSYWSDAPRSDIRVLALNPEEAIGMRMRDEMRTRKFKEDYFRGADQAINHQQETQPVPVSKVLIGEVWDGIGCITEDFVGYCLNKDDSPCKFSLNQLSDEWNGAGLDKKDTWRGHFRSALRHVKDKWNLDSRTSIVVTGGATRMQFVEEDIVQVFNPSKKPYFGDDGARSFSVVKGLAWAAYARRTLKTAESDVEKILESEEVQNEIIKFVMEYLEKPAEKIASKVTESILPRLRSHDSSVGTLRKLRAEYSEVFVNAINNFIHEANNGIDISTLLEKAPIKNINNERQAEFARANVTIDKHVMAALPWSYNQIGIDFDVFEGHDWVFASDEDESFEGVLGWGLKYDNAADGFSRSFSKSKVLEIFTKEIPDTDGNKLPSDAAMLYFEISSKVKDFVKAEISAMEGAVEYGSN